MASSSNSKIHHRTATAAAAVASLSDRFKDDAKIIDDVNKPDFREIDLGSPVSPLRARPSGLTPATTSSSSSSSDSVPGRVGSNLSNTRALTALRISIRDIENCAGEASEEDEEISELEVGVQAFQ